MNNDMTSEYWWLSRNKFQELLEHYRSTNTATRRAKTFINQDMYNDIKGVLEDSRYSHGREKRFGTWVRDRFKLTVFGNGIAVVTLLRDETKTIAVEEQLYNTITRAHEECSHGGRDATLHKLKGYAYCPERFVQLVLKHCSHCATTNAPNVTQSAAQAIHASSFLEIVQMDLIDYGRNDSPDGLPRYILHIKDHRSKFSWAYSLLTKELSVVGKKLHDLFCLVGPPIFLQSDNGGEFTAQAMKDELQSNWPTLRFINGRPRHPQSQGLIERGNRTLVQKLNAWVANQNATGEDPKHWSEGLGMVVYAMNTSRTRVLRDTAYRYLYGQDPHPDDTVNQEYIDRSLNRQHVVDGEAVGAIPKMAEVYQSGEGDDSENDSTTLSSQDEGTAPDDDDNADDGSLDFGDDDENSDDVSIGFGDDEGGSHVSHDAYSNSINADTGTESLQEEENHDDIEHRSSNNDSGDTMAAPFLEVSLPRGRGLMTIPVEDADGIRAYMTPALGQMFVGDDDYGIAPPSPLSQSSTEPATRNAEFERHTHSEHSASNNDEDDDVSINRHSAIRNAAATHYNNNVESIQQQLLARQPPAPECHVGDYVGVHIDNRDRSKRDSRYLPCIVYDVIGRENSCPKYKVRCKHGLIQTAYHERELKDFTHHEFRELESISMSLIDDNIPTISVREAARLSRESQAAPVPQVCNCTTGCKTNRCPCRRLNQYCNDGCHRGSQSGCSNSHDRHNDNGRNNRRKARRRGPIGPRPITRSLSTRRTRSSRQ